MPQKCYIRGAARKRSLRPLGLTKNEMDNFILYLIIGILVTLVMSYLNKNSNREIQPKNNGVFYLRLHKMYWYIGLGGIIFGIVGFVLPGLLVIDTNGWIIGLFFLSLFGGLGTACLLWYKNHKLFFDTNKIASTSVFSRKTEMKWESIISVKFNPISGVLIFKDSNGLKVKAHLHLVGIKELLNMLEHKTVWKIKDLKLPYK